MKPDVDAEELNILQILDTAVRQKDVRSAIDSVIERVEDRLRQDSRALLVWEPVPLATYREGLPDTIGSSWVFVLRARASTGAERHPDSRQSMVSYRGSGDLQTWAGGGWRSNPLVCDLDAPVESRCISIPPNVWHQAVVPEENWVVVSFHTVPENELTEERPATGDTQLPRQRRYLDKLDGNP